MTFFMIFSKNFQKLLKNSKTLKISILLLDIVRVLSGVLNLAFDFGCSSPCSFLYMTFFLDFFKIFQKNLNVKKFRNFEDINPVIGIFERTLRELRILPLNMAAQILVVFEI